MGNGLLAFAAGMGTGYLNQQQRNREQARQDKQDAWTEKEQGRQEQAWGREDKLQRGLASATNKAEVNENGAIISLADGTKTVYDDADVAGSDFRMLRRADEATGRQTLAKEPMGLGSALNTVAPAPVSVDGVKPAGGLSTPLSMGTSAAPVSADAAPPAAGLAGFKVPMAPQRTATMNGKAYGSLTEAQAAGKVYDTPEARSERQAAAYDAAGQPEKAMQMRLSAMGMDEKMQAHINEKFNQGYDKNAAANGGDYIKTNADYLTKSGIPGLDGVTSEVRTSPDGKKKQIWLIRPDKTEKMGQEYTNDAVGQELARTHALRVGTDVKTKMLHDFNEQDRKVKADDNKYAFQQTMLDFRGKQIELQAAVAEAKAAGRAAGGDYGSRVHSTLTDSNGHMVAIMGDGTPKRLSSPDGTPMQSQSVSKRLDNLVKNLQTNGGSKYKRMSYSELQEVAQGILSNESGGANTPTPHGLSTPQPTAHAPVLAPPSPKTPAQPAAAKANYSNLWK